MKKYTIYIISLLALCACQSAIRFKPMQLERAVDKTGIVENYTFDESQPKVVTYIGSIQHFSDWVHSTNLDGVKEAIQRYEDFEFLFYLRVQSAEELTKAIDIAERYNIDFPIYIDDQDKFRDRNIGDYMAPGLVTTILDEKNKEYLCTVLALKLSGFDEHMQAAIEAMEADGQKILATAALDEECEADAATAQNNQGEASEVVECQFSKWESAGEIKDLFKSATILPLEQCDNSRVSSECELLEFNGDYYFIDKEQVDCLRFDKDGKFKNSIGRWGKKSGEYLDIASVQVDGNDILVYSMMAEKIYRYSVNGDFLGSVDTGISAQQLLKVGDKYYGYFGFDNGQQEERILVYNDAFERVGQYLPSSAKLIVVMEAVSPITLYDGDLYVRETYSNAIFKITDDGEVTTPIEFDFKSYNIPELCFVQADAHVAAQIMLSNDFAYTYRFEQTPNHTLACIVYQMTKETPLYDKIGIRRNGADFDWITATRKGSNALLFYSVRNISDQGVVTALVDADVVKSFNAGNQGFINNSEVLQSLDGDNPLIVKLKIK